MIQRIERAAGALLIVAGVLILIGVGLSIAKPGGLGDDDKQSAAASTSSSTTTSDASSTTVAESTTTAASEPTTTGVAQAGATTTTTAAGSGLGTSGSGTAGETPIVNTGGPVWAPPMGAALLALAVALRRLRRRPV